MSFFRSRQGRPAAFLCMGLAALVLVGSGYAFRDICLEEWCLWKLDWRDGETRKKAAETLGGKGSPRVLRRLVRKCLEKKRAASQGASKSQSPAASPRDFALFGTEPWTFEVAAWNVIYRNRNASFPLLIGLLREDDADVRFFAAQALSLMGTTPRSVVPGLEEALKDEDPGVRKAAAAALEKVCEDS